MRRVVASLTGAAAVLLGCAGVATDPDPVVLRLALADDWANVPVIVDAVTGFERDHPGVRVEITGVPFAQIPETVLAAGEVDRPYELAQWHAFAAGAAGLAAPVDDLWAARDLVPDDFLPGAVTDVTWDGRRYGLPLDVNALVLLARTTHLQGAGLTADDLRDLDGFAEVASELAALSGTDHALVVTGSSWSAYGWIVAHGGRLLELAPDGTAALDPDGLPTFTFEDPATLAALELLVELVESGAAPPPLAPDLATSAVASFADGRAALHASGSWDLVASQGASSGSAGSGPVQVLPLPQADPERPRTVLGGSSLFLPVDGRHRELAFDLALALTTREVGVALVEAAGRLPARRDAYEAPELRASPQLRAVVAELEHATVMPLIAYPQVATAFRDGLEAILSGRSSPAVAMAEVQAVAERWRETR